MMTKVPTRTCIACGEQSAKQGLVRVVKSPKGIVRLDSTGKAAGRGAYVCRKRECFDKARDKHLFDGRLRTRLSVEDYANLQRDFDALCASNEAL